MKKLLLMLLSFMLLSTAGCVNVSGESSGKISAPRNFLIPVAGTWEVAGVIENGALQQEAIPESWQENSVQFTEDFALLGGNLLNNPRYKMKRVNKEEYLLYGHKSFPRELDTAAQELDVITVTDEDKFLCEIIRLNSEALLLEIDNRCFYLQKKSDQVSSRSALSKYQGTAGSLDLGVENSKESPRTGVLVGLCSPASGTTNKMEKKYQYRTFWIAATDKILHPIQQTPGIIFPRRSGFWRLEVMKSTDENGFSGDLLLVSPVAAGAKKTKTALSAKTDLKKTEKQKENERQKEAKRPKAGEALGNIIRRIRYVGNDYVSIESTDTDNAESVLQVLPIDSLPGIKPVKITDLAGEAGLAAMKEGRNKVIKELGLDEGSIAGALGQDDAFGLERKMGHWFFKGRINYQLGDRQNTADYSINVLPPKELIFFDELSVPWTAVKDQIPEAVDAFTSPNKDIALVITRAELLIYGVKDRNLESQPLGKVALKPGESVVMAEWAIGHYVEGWENSFVNERTLE